jgi:hypothetical protein
MIKSKPVIFDIERGVVVPMTIAPMDDLPNPARNFLNVSEPGPNMKNLEADIMTRQTGQITLLRDQKRTINYASFERPINFQRFDYADVPTEDLPFIGVVSDNG